MTLQEFFTEHPKAALGCSGGVDSSYLLWAAVNAGADIAPYYIQTAFQPAFELEDAQRLCAQIGVKLNVIRNDFIFSVESTGCVPAPVLLPKVTQGVRCDG